jgi:UMP-CMP kinase
MPVVEMFGSEDRVVKVDATAGPEDVYKKVQEGFSKAGIEKQTS